MNMDQSITDGARRLEDAFGGLGRAMSDASQSFAVFGAVYEDAVNAELGRLRAARAARKATRPRWSES